MTLAFICPWKRRFLKIKHMTLLVLNGLPWWLWWWRIHLQRRRPAFSPWVGKIPWRRKWQPTAIFLPEESHGQRSLVGYSPWGGKESNTDWAPNTHSPVNSFQEKPRWAGTLSVAHLSAPHFTVSVLKGEIALLSCLSLLLSLTHTACSNSHWTCGHRHPHSRADLAAVGKLKAHLVGPQ